MAAHVFSYAARPDQETQLKMVLEIFKNTPFRGLQKPGESWVTGGRDSDVFGNDFRPITFDPAWRTDTAVSLARGMYESRDFGAMPILADALQDAGCDNEHILNHCRGISTTHVRGCWVVDLVLGKE